MKTKIVSLLPSATEIVCALGAASNLVGTSHECDYPEAVRGLPHLTGSSITSQGSSREIDSAVRAVLNGALSIYSVDYEKLGELAPDVILTQDLCEVCAVSLTDVRGALARLAHQDNIRIVSLKPTRLQHVLDDMVEVAKALDLEFAGQQLRSQLQERIDSIRTRAHRITERPRVATVEWLDPIMLGGTWMPELIELAGGIAVGARAGQPAPTVTAQELEALRPDIVLLKPCGFSIERTLQERDLLEQVIRPALSPSAHVYLTDGNAYFNRPGPRLVESLEIMAACLHPHSFPELVERHQQFLIPC